MVDAVPTRIRRHTKPKTRGAPTGEVAVARGGEGPVKGEDTHADGPKEEQDDGHVLGRVGAASACALEEAEQEAEEGGDD